jgi:hypothetical protein
VLIIVSFTLNIGEVLQYDDYFKRAFYFFGDGINIILIFLFFVLLVDKNPIYSLLSFIAFLMALGKVAIVLMFICLFIVIVIQRQQRKLIMQRFILSLSVSMLCYFPAAHLSNHLSDITYSDLLPNISSSNETYSVKTIKQQNIANRIKSGSCADLTCLKAHLTYPLRMRLLSIVAGVWMTSQGGFAGNHNVFSPDGFADLIYNANPFNVNDDYGVTYKEWKEIAVVQNAIIGIGAGYGPVAMLLLISFLGFVILSGWFKYKNNDSYMYGICLAYFTTIAIFDQSQAYIQAYNINLIVLSYCGFYILKQIYFSDRYISLLRSSLFSKN